MNLILAATRSEANAFAKSQGWRAGEWSYLSGAGSLKNIAYDEIHLLPSFKGRRDYHARMADIKAYRHKRSDAPVIQPEEWEYRFTPAEPRLTPRPNGSAVESLSRLRRQVVELEAEVERLQEENAELRQTIANDRGFSEANERWEGEGGPPLLEKPVPAYELFEQVAEDDDEGKNVAPLPEDEESRVLDKTDSIATSSGANGPNSPRRHSREELEVMKKPELKDIARKHSIVVTNQGIPRLVNQILEAQNG